MQQFGQDPILARAQAAAMRGDFQGAATLLQQAAKRNPKSAQTHQALAQMLMRTGQTEPALRHAHQAAKLAPKNAPLQYAVGAMFANLADYPGALAAYAAAARLNPRNAEPHVDTATIHEILSQTDEAQAAIDRALAINPRHARARVISIRLAVRNGAPDQETLAAFRADLEQIIEAPDIALTRALALEILIDVCERLSDSDAAWTAMTQCNEIDRRAAVPPQTRDAYLRTIDQLAASTLPELTARWRDACPDDGLPSPALLVGFPRSGTTMTERMLDAHPAIETLEEKPPFDETRQHVARLLPREALAGRPAGEVLEALTPEHIGVLRAHYWDRAAHYLGKKPEPGTVILDKMPLRLTELPFVNRIFPDAKILVAIRDPRDVCLSCFRQRFNVQRNVAMSFFLDINDTARFYQHVMQFWLTTRDAYTLPCHQFRYEDVVSEFETHARGLIEFLGLPWDNAVLSFHETSARKASATPSYHAIRQRVSTKAVGRWKRYEDHLAPIFPTLAPFLSAFGYDA